MPRRPLVDTVTSAGGSVGSTGVSTEARPRDGAVCGERPVGAGAVRDPGAAGAEESGESCPADPVDPDEPVVSAKATAGNPTIADPTPSATANAPTRPTNRPPRCALTH